ncbi:hypothetical protein WQQ_31170 [Hydrocarboniphaga effusa AP103]|uniref:Uncharacterized protein n=1 Tax=Hydrocarboniphaga effusa AP103 TaxID=1172194 RepID=I8T6I6_9GAMM|nr:hypothetical protein WQQ_31170 [Hydrocarboniphaga effusa AP103]
MAPDDRTHGRSPGSGPASDHARLQRSPGKISAAKRGALGRNQMIGRTASCCE